MEEYLKTNIKNPLHNCRLMCIDYLEQTFYYQNVWDRDVDKDIKLSFDNILYSYKITVNEISASKLTEELNKLSRDFIFEVNDSNYLMEFHEKSFGIFEKEKVKHYLISSTEDILEVLTLGTLIFEEIEKVQY